MKKILLLSIWFPTLILTLFSNLWLYSYKPEILSLGNSEKEEIITLTHTPYNFYSSLPQILGAKSVNNYYVESQDIIPEITKNYLKMHKSPMTETSNDLVRAARKYEIDPIMMLSIAQCESNLGKKMPHKTEDKLECKNPFGWGIHSAGTLCFNSWQEGYEKVAKGLREKYFNDGLTNPEEIMHRYTPPALEKEGSWAKCVNYFMQKIADNQEEILNYSNL